MANLTGHAYASLGTRGDCVSGASKDKNAPQRFADEDNSQILTEMQQEFKMDLPTDHEITDADGKRW